MSHWAQTVVIWFTMATTSINTGIFSDPGGSAPCGANCALTAALRLNEQPPLADNRQLPASDCKLPCNCTPEPMACKAGVNIIEDGCGCCTMCARQQGDLCNARDKCDEEKGLYCPTGADGGTRGTCRARFGKPCVIDGKEYEDGIQFNLNCSLLCTCQDGKYACSSRCPQELRAPSSIHCKDSHLVAIKGQCCKEWVCPHQHSMIDRGDNGTVSDRCRKETTAWSACSVTCGTGESIRVTSDLEECKPKQERRICIIRPCETTNNQLPPGQKCRSIYEAAAPTKIVHEEKDGTCISKDEHNLKYCSTCKRNKCCGPNKIQTLPVDFLCSGGTEVAEKLVMFIESCKCHHVKECPFL